MIRHQSFYHKHEGLILGGTAVAVVIAVWEFAWCPTLYRTSLTCPKQGWISPLFFSGPSAIVKQFWYLLMEENLIGDILFSGQNFVLGLSIAIAAGVVLGVIVGWYRRVRLVLDPFLNALYATPRIAMIPLIIIWFGIDVKSKVFIVFMSAFFPVLINTVAGVRNMDADLLRAARAFCATDWQIFKTLAVPGSVPFILTGIRQGVALGLIGVVVGEMFGSSQGVGYRIVFGGQTFQTDTVFVGVLIVALSGMLLTFLTERLERRFSRWRPER
jgi:ABC-type nitrate/sulfonate/bicarbonate transport system permease component